ncbi:MAG: anti-sigma F factor [Clostridia bacterium]|nr:anti-sigma F factor [Clostridia bacterium]
MLNETYIKIKAKVENISLIRVCVASFLSNTNITLDELQDIKTAVSEAVTNAIEHGYENDENKNVEVEMKLAEVDQMVYYWVKIVDKGVGIEDIELATTPTYTNKPELEHAGMGFTIMETFMDEVQIDSAVGEGTTVTMTKKLKTIKS